jgi:gluconate 5-dehydrogenase
MSRASIDGCVVVAAGAGSFAGRALAEAFVATGANVVFALADQPVPTEGQPQEGAVAGTDERIVRFADSDKVEALAVEVASRFSRLNVWVNDFTSPNKGVPAETLAASQWAQAVEESLFTTFRCCQAAGRVMLSQGGGAIVNVLSPDAYIASSGSSATCVAMAGIEMITRALAVEWASRGVRVVGAAGPRPAAEGPARRVPLGHPGSASELAQAVVFLAGPDADYITGEVLPVDGGWASYQLF